jgi:hypothetical protein
VYYYPVYICTLIPSGIYAVKYQNNGQKRTKRDIFQIFLRECYRQRNLPLLRKIAKTYGACAILARDGDHIVGQLRFYPKAICDLKGAGGLCLQQDHPAGPAEDFADHDFPPLAQIEDKTLVVHCLMTGSPQQRENPYQRKGIGTRMVRALIQWAKTNGWERNEADSYGSSNLPSRILAFRCRQKRL